MGGIRLCAERKAVDGTGIVGKDGGDACCADHYGCCEEGRVKRLFLRGFSEI